jgi:hypothetical protein
MTRFTTGIIELLTMIHRWLITRLIRKWLLLTNVLRRPFITIVFHAIVIKRLTVVRALMIARIPALMMIIRRRRFITSITVIFLIAHPI